VEVGAALDFEASPLQLRGVVKNALVEAFNSHAVDARVDADSPDILFVVRRAGTPEARRTVVGIDLGGGARHLRGARVAMGPAPMRETMASQLIMLSRWDARSEPLVDPMTGGGTIPIEAAGLAAGAAIRRPEGLRLKRLSVFEGLPREAPDLFPGTIPRILATDVDPARIPAIVGNLRAAGLTGPEHARSMVIAQHDIRQLTPEYVYRKLPGSVDMKPGVFCFNPPYGVRMGAEDGDKKLMALYSDAGRVLSRFKGWRAACFVANPRFVGAFGHRPAISKPASNAELRGAFLVYEF
jgi:putative N6-adenine-specific DNA methylase